MPEGDEEEGSHEGHSGDQEEVCLAGAGVSTGYALPGANKGQERHKGGFKAYTVGAVMRDLRGLCDYSVSSWLWGIVVSQAAM